MTRLRMPMLMDLPKQNLGVIKKREGFCEEKSEEQNWAEEPLRQTAQKYV